MERAFQPTLRGGRLVVTAVAVFAVTLVVPPAAAWRLNTRRIRETQATIGNAAEYVREHLAEISNGDEARAIVRGTGRLPFGSDGPPGEWVRRAVGNPDLFGKDAGPDEWGRCLFIDLEGLQEGHHVWVLSAGPNMTVDTPPGSPVLLGDDVGEMIK